jgi:hypothetical protein
MIAHLYQNRGYIKLVAIKSKVAKSKASYQYPWAMSVKKQKKTYYLLYNEKD